MNEFVVVLGSSEDYSTGEVSNLMQLIIPQYCLGIGNQKMWTCYAQYDVGPERGSLKTTIAKFTEDNGELTKVVAELDVRSVVVLLPFFPTYTSAEDNDDPAMV